MTAGMHAAAAASARIPVWSDDEIGPLATARLVAGVGEPLSLNHLSYYPGWAVVMAPLWWISSDPAVVYRLAVGLAAVMACLTMVPLAAIARRLGTTWPVAVTLAAIVMAAPSRVVMSNYATSEAFFALMVAVTAWGGVRFADRASPLRAGLLAVAAAATFFSHGRGLVVVIAVALLFASRAVIDARAGRQSWRIEVGGLVALLVLSAALFAAHKGLASTLYGSGPDREDASVDAVINGLAGPWGRGLAGQLWYALVAWVMLPAVGVVALGGAVRREWAARRPGAASWWAVLLMGAMVMGTLAATTIMTSTPVRFDALVYGRYVDPFLLPLVLLALVSLTRGLARPGAGVAFAGGAAVLAVFVLVVVPRSTLGGLWFPMNIGGLLLWSWPYGGDDAPPFLRASLVAVVAGGVILLGALNGRRGRGMSLVVIAALLVAGSAHAQASVLPPWTAVATYVPKAASALDRIDAELGEQVPVVYFSQGMSYTSQNLVQYWALPRAVPVVDQVADLDPESLIIGPRTWPWAIANGARAVAQTAQAREVVWVLPGDLAERLAGG